MRFSTKEQIVATIKEWGLDKLTHFCEYPNKNIATGRCGECVPCRTYEDALIMMDIHKRNRNDSFQYATLNYDCKFDYEGEVLKCVDEPVIENKVYLKDIKIANEA